MSSRVVVTIALGFLAASASGQVAAWGQCGGIGYSGSATCASGSGCVKVNDYYSQCQPGAAVPTSAAPSATIPPAGTSTVISPNTPTSTVTGPGATLQTGYYWIRGVESPYFHFYLQSSLLYTASTAYLASYTTAGQFAISSGQLTQLVSAPGQSVKVLYAVVDPTTHYDGKALAVSFSESKNTYGTWSWQGDGLSWSTPEITRPNAIAWYICGGGQVYINLGNYAYGTPDGCADQTIHYYNDSKANN